MSMRYKRAYRPKRPASFSLPQLIATIVATFILTVGALLLTAWLIVGKDGLTIVSALGIVNSVFVGEYTLTEVTDATMEAMVDSLDDRWSYYLDAEGYEAQNSRRANQYVGIGVTVSYGDERGLSVISVTEGGPADKAGIVAGDVIISVDGTSLAGDGRYDGTTLIAGEAGTTVELTLLGEEEAERTLTVKRQSIDSVPVSYAMLEDDIGYVQLDNFYDTSADYLEAAVLDLQEQGAQSLIFDMRDNGGGYLDQLHQMLDFLLPEGAIFIARDRAGNEDITYSDADCIDLPMVVLVNENSYSAAEFFAAELQEQGVAIIIGAETSGKGYSQQTFPLPNGGSLSISTSAYFTGEGVSLIGTGVTLDQEVEIPETGEDTQLQAAVDYFSQ